MGRLVAAWCVFRAGGVSTDISHFSWKPKNGGNMKPIEVGGQSRANKRSGFMNFDLTCLPPLIFFPSLSPSPFSSPPLPLHTQGQNIILNMNDHGFVVCAYNRTTEKVDRFLENEAKGGSHD